MTTTHPQLRPHARHTVVLTTVVGLHALLAAALIIATAGGYLQHVVIPIGPIHPPARTPPRIVEKIPEVQSIAHPQVTPPTMDADFKAVPPSVIADDTATPVDPTESAAAAALPAHAAPAIVPVQMTEAGRRRVTDACGEAYPAESRRLHEEGTVTVLLYVSPEGRATDVRVEHSSGYPRLDRANVACVQAAGRAFTPQREGGRSVGVWQSMSYRWQLQ